MKNIAVVTGGDSGEAKISFQSADQVILNIDRKKFIPYKIIIQKGKWYFLNEKKKEIPVDKNDFSITIGGKKIIFDFVFLMIHGTPGEDGKLQGYFDLIGLPYSTSGLHTSAITFNKEICKRVLAPLGINMAKSLLIYTGEKINEKEILKKVGLPCFVKPNNGGSSIGTTKVEKKGELKPAILKALKEDSQAILESFISGREITCGVVNYRGNIRALAITEIVPPKTSKFFDLKSKYDGSTKEITPANIPGDKYRECLRLSEKIYKELNCKGIIRIDYFLSGRNFFLLEVNSIPGMTGESLIPKQAGHVGISFKELLTNSIEC